MLPLLFLAAATLSLALPSPPLSRQQLPFHAPLPPLPHISSSSSPPPTALQTHSHPHHPHHHLRLTHPTLCDSTVNSTSGYLDTAKGHHAFFWAFESRGNVKEDPVVLWCVSSPSVDLRER